MAYVRQAPSDPCSATYILHCPNKGGLATCNIFDKQLATKGLSRLDMAAGCTDGGGENVGQDGIHEACRSVRPDYSQRRCFGHFPWTVVKAGLKELPSNGAIDNLNSYITNDQSWQRLAAIATQGIMQGGLALMLYGSAEYKRHFSSAPPRLIDDRPDCYTQFIGWLADKQVTLTRCITLDLQQRNMRRTWGARCILTLTSRFDCMVRNVEFILFSRAMYPYYKVKAETCLALCGSTDDLIRRTASWLLDTSLDDKVAEELGIVDAGHLAELKAMRPYSMTWIEAAVLLADVEPATTLGG